MIRNLLNLSLFGVLLAGFSGCANFWSHQAPPKVAVRDQVPAEMTDRLVNGTVDHVWAEPMNDQVRVPAQIDPNNVYFRPSHETVVEIRHERYQEVQFPDKK
jgi:hypothetical protein